MVTLKTVGAMGTAALLLGLTASYAQQETQTRQERQDSAKQGQKEGEQRSGQRERGSATRERTQTQSAERGHGQHGEADLTDVLANCLILDNQGEVQISEFGHEQSQNEQVKEFSKMAIDDHTKFIDKLQQFASAPGQPREGQRGESTQDRERRESTSTNESSGANATEARDGLKREGQETAQQSPRGEGEIQRGFRAGQDSDQHGKMAAMGAVMQELNNQMIESCRRELSEKQGAEFDRCYMTKQVAMHQAMLDKLQVYSGHVSPELQQTLQEGQQTTQQHLAHAKEILASVEQGQTR